MASLNIGFVLFPNLTQLDFTGPLQVLHRLPDSKTHIVAKTRDPVPSDCGLGLVPTTTFADCRATRSPLRARRLRRLGRHCRQGDRRLRAPPGRAREVRHLRVHGRLRAGRCRPAEGAAGHHALGLHGAPAHGGRDLREGPRRARRQRLHRRRRHGRHRFRADRRRRGGGRRDGPAHPAVDRVRPRAALRRRPSRPRAGGRSRAAGGALRDASRDLPRRAASRR